ncbi:MAG: hypothetical protein II875_01180 [Clostridia bacterium]|nr:hypothetical protein [Clostridia bacterium]
MAILLYYTIFVRIIQAQNGKDVDRPEIGSMRPVSPAAFPLLPPFRNYLHINLRLHG